MKQHKSWLVAGIFSAIYLFTPQGMSSHSVMPEKQEQDTAWYWDFNQWNKSLGWTIPESIAGGILGGAVWINIQNGRGEFAHPPWTQMIWGQDLHHDLVSPGGLNISASQYTKVVLRILNYSPETDGLIFWKTNEAPDVETGPVRFTMKPDTREWQEITCHMDDHWKGTIDQIMIRPAQMWNRGDIWIDWIAVAVGEPRIEKSRPNLYHEKIVPKIVLPGISQEDFRDAFRVLDECLVTDVPMRGFNYPFLAPGGAYGQNWWQLDGSLNVAGAKWVNQPLVENIIRGYSEVQAQNPDGRIDLWGGSTVRGQVADVSSIPRFFEAAWDVARRSDDPLLQEESYDSMKKYLSYWFSSSKKDEQTGLITAVFEESFGGPGVDPGILAAVDLNVAVAVGCHYTSQLASHLGYLSEAAEYSRLFDQLRQSINRTLWHPERNVYLNYNVREKRHYPRLVCSTFDPLQAGIAPDERIEKMVKRLVDPKYFNWGIRPVTSIAMTEPAYVEAEGTYDGRAWLGDIWTMRNIPIIRGLQDIGRHDLATELNWSTINTFNANYCEYAVPSTGSGEGVQRYGWSASQYIQCIIEYLFGIDYDRLERRIRILPHIPEDLMGVEISIADLIIPGDHNTRLSLSIKPSMEGEVDVQVSISGPLPEGKLEVLWPLNNQHLISVVDGNGKTIPILKTLEDLKNVSGISIPVSRTEKLRFTLDPKGS